MTDFTWSYLAGILPLLLSGMADHAAADGRCRWRAGCCWAWCWRCCASPASGRWRWRPASYVNLLRSLPLLLLIFWFYFLVPLLLGRPVGGMTSALIGFILFEACVFL